MSRPRVGSAAREAAAAGRVDDATPAPVAPGRSVPSIADLPAPWNTDPYVVADFPRWRSPVMWGGQVAALFAVLTAGGGHALVGVGEPAGLARVLRGAVAAGLARPDGTIPLDDGHLVSASLTRGAWDLVGEGVQGRLSLPRVSRWDWMWIEEPLPVVERESEVAELDLGGAAEEVRELHTTALPGTYFPVDREGARWFGWRDETARLRAVAGADGWDRTVHLGGIATDPAWRRRGLGTAVTAAATRAGLAATGRVSLGLYSDNHVARRTYERLGFRMGQRWESRRPKQG